MGDNGGEDTGAGELGAGIGCVVACAGEGGRDRGLLEEGYRDGGAAEEEGEEEA